MKPTWSSPDLQRIARRVLQLGLLLVAGSCIGKQTTIVPNEAPPSARDFGRWFTCSECTEGQLDTLLAHSTGRNRDPVRDTLSQAVRVGPAAAVLAALRAAAEKGYDSLQASLIELQLEPLDESKNEYAEGELQNYVRLVRVRAAIALQRVDSATARRVIESTARTTPDSSLAESLLQLTRRPR